jgi:hypothetical protein
MGRDRRGDNVRGRDARGQHPPPHQGTAPVPRTSPDTCTTGLDRRENICQRLHALDRRIRHLQARRARLAAQLLTPMPPDLELDRKVRR